MFGKLPAKEREKMIKDNRLCPFCLLHDKDKLCGAKQKPVACSASSCKGRHIQKLHEFLKDVFREENQVHVVHREDEWEESEEAWELGEEEMMIVGTVQQEDRRTIAAGKMPVSLGWNRTMKRRSKSTKLERARVRMGHHWRQEGEQACTRLRASMEASRLAKAGGRLPGGAIC